MCAPAQARWCARIHGDRPVLSLGNCPLPAAASMGEGESALCPQSRACQDEQPYHLDALLWPARILSSFQSPFHAGIFPRIVRFRTTALFDLGPRKTSSLARVAVAPGSARMRVSCDPRVRRPFPHRHAKEVMQKRSAAMLLNCSGCDVPKTAIEC